MTSDTSIAVTAFAWSTPLGDDLDAVWKRLCAGETGLVPIPHTAHVGGGAQAPTRLRNDHAGAVPSVPLDAPAAERMMALGLPPLRRVLAEAGCDPAQPDVLLVLGTSLGAFLEGEPESAPLHAWADALGRAVGAAREPVSLSTACSSGSDAILVGAELIRAGVARVCVCGGVDVLTMSKRLAHSALGSMSPTMLRAFDVRHDGTLLGEGAGFVVLEAAPTTRAPLAYLRGVGSANDAAGMTTPDAAGLGARYALARSLEDAGLAPDAIGIVNAHGSGTPLNDATEAMAFRDVFGDAPRSAPVVFATKGNFGHSLGATGVLEAIAVLLALRTGEVPPVYGLEQPDPALQFPLPQGSPLRHDARFGLSVTLGFGGFDTSLVFEKGSVIAGLATLGRGEAVEAKRARFDAPAITAIRYADPAAWITVTAVANAVEAARDAVAAAHDRVGVVVTSAEGPVEAMAAMCEASRGGSSSPIRFPASNAGSLAGLTSIAFGFRGPTLMLTLPPDRGVTIARVLAAAWLRRGIVDYVAIAATSRRGGAPVSRCLLLGAPVATGETPELPGAPLDADRDLAWLGWLAEGP